MYTKYRLYRVQLGLLIEILDFDWTDYLQKRWWIKRKTKHSFSVLLLLHVFHLAHTHTKKMNKHNSGNVQNGEILIFHNATATAMPGHVSHMLMHLFQMVFGLFFFFNYHLTDIWIRNKHSLSKQKAKQKKKEIGKEVLSWTSTFNFWYVRLCVFLF